MKKQNLIFGAIAATMMLASCGGTEEQEVQEDMSNDTTEVSNDTEDDSDMTEDDTENSEESSSADEWNEVLDDYEDYVDNYIAIIKKQKADPTDMSIMTEYQELMQKGTEWSNKMSEMSSEFGPEQLSRMQEIQAKISKAAM